MKTCCDCAYLRSRIESEIAELERQADAARTRVSRASYRGEQHGLKRVLSWVLALEVLELQPAVDAVARPLANDSQADPAR